MKLIFWYTETMREHKEILEKLESLDDHTLMKAVDGLQKTSWEDDAPLRNAALDRAEDKYEWFYSEEEI